MSTHNGKNLKYSLKEVGIWLVKGEDTSCGDWGSLSNEPSIGYFSGTLKDVIKHAVELPNFWSWGGGGSFTKQKPPTVIKV